MNVSPWKLLVNCQSKTVNTGRCNLLQKHELSQSIYILKVSVIVTIVPQLLGSFDTKFTQSGK